MVRRKRVVLTFPHSLVDKPITYHLVKDYGLVFNILKARVTPREEGRLVLEIEGKRENLNRGIKFLKNLGIGIKPLAQDIRWIEERCTHCGACVALCPTQAFTVDPKTRKVSFNKKKCILCELCVKACPYRAMEICF
jgi:ferredoxin